MSDFTSSGWSVFVAVATVLSIVACIVLLLIAARRRVVPGVTDNSTGHVWDEDLRELNNPLPRWWMGLFVLTVVFSLGYLALYPGLGSFAGTLGWSSEKELQSESKAAQRLTQPLYAKFAAMDEAALKGDPDAMALGERLFVANCAACHGSDARGSKGFPNLTDGEWLWGSDFEAVKQSIAGGRQGVMPPLGAAVGSPEEIRQLAHHVLSLSSSPHDAALAQRGKAKFATCAACHGPAGKGNAALGAPDLSDAVWLHGAGEEAIVSMIVNGKVNVMPAHAERLSPEQIHVLTAYVKRRAR
jgi:cytochrome c oxidase cbb3-type subunit III